VASAINSMPDGARIAGVEKHGCCGVDGHLVRRPPDDCSPWAWLRWTHNGHGGTAWTLAAAEREHAGEAVFIQPLSDF
jgi:hypothetical protein